MTVSRTCCGTQANSSRVARQNSFSSLLLKYTLKSFYKIFLDSATSARNWTSFGKCPSSSTGLCSGNRLSHGYHVAINHFQGSCMHHKKLSNVLQLQRLFNTSQFNILPFRHKTRLACTKAKCVITVSVCRMSDMVFNYLGYFF